MKTNEKELILNMPEDMVYENLTLKSDFIFGKVMQNKEICLELIRILTGNAVDENVTINNQKPIKVTNDSKGIRYDVYVEDDNTAYDAEMQNRDSASELPKRTRFYQGMMDLNLLESGRSYKGLKNSYVIFICTYDPFGYDLCCYRFENIAKNSDDLPLNDGRIILMFNTKGKRENVSKEIKAFLDYVETKHVTNEFTKALDNEVEKAKQNAEWRVEYMKTWTREMDLREEGREKGREEGREEGREAAFAQVIVKKIEKGKNLDEIAYDMEMERDDIQELYYRILNETSNYKTK